MEFNILISFLIATNIAFVVIIMSVTLLMDLKLRSISKDISKMAHLMEAQQKKDN